MLWGIGVLGVWLFQKTYFPFNDKSPNQWGEVQAPDGSWYVPNPIEKGLTMDRWDDAFLAVLVLGVILFSKPWK